MVTRNLRAAAAMLPAVLAMTAVSCKPGTVQQGPRVRVAIGGQAQFVYLPTTLAQQLGYYNDEGLAVELADFQGGSKALESLFGGSADVVSGFFDHTVQMAAEGKSLVAFVNMLRYPGLALVVSPKAPRPIQSVADLAGLPVGVSAPGSSTHLLLNHLVARHSGAAPPPAAIGVGMAAGSVAAMESGKVAAAIMAEPAISQLRERTGGATLQVLAETQTAAGCRAAYGVDTYPAAVLYSTKDWIATNPVLAQRMARAIARTLAWIQAHSAEEIAAKMPQTMRGTDAAIYAKALAASKEMYSPDGLFSAEAAAAVVRVLAESMEKVRLAKPDVSRCYTNEFVPRMADVPKQ